MLRWSATRLWRNGRWLAGSTIMSWAGNSGLIPFAGATLGVGASGSLRALQVLMSPPFQVNVVLSSLIIPACARRLRVGGGITATRAALLATALFGGIAGTYSLVVTFGGEWLFRFLFGANAEGVPPVAIALTALGFALESAKLGCYVVSISLGDTLLAPIGQVVSLVSTFALLLILFRPFGLLGIVAAVAIGNNMGTLAVVAYFRGFVRRTRVR